LFEKGKFTNDSHPLAIEGKKGKDSLFIDLRPFEYKVTHIDFYGLIFENIPSFDWVNYFSHINVNDVISKDVMKISSYDIFYNDNSVDSVGLVHPVQIVNVCDSSLIRPCPGNISWLDSRARLVILTSSSQLNLGGF